MSFGTCYGASNNTYSELPPLMSDGRNFSNWNPGNVIDNQIKKKNNITNNNEYRKYLIKNGNNLVKLNQQEACNNCGCCPINFNNKATSNSPYLYSNCLSQEQPDGYEKSNLKNIYLSKEQLEIIKSEPIYFKLK